MINLATIGTSWITRQFIEACKQTGEYNIRKIYSRSIDKARALVLEVGSGIGIDGFDALYDKDIDVVYIASPNALHFEQAMSLIANGKHVIIEKPQVTDILQWKELHRQAKEKKRMVFDAVRHIHTDNYRYLKKLVDHTRQATVYPFLGAHFALGQYSSKYDAYISAMNKGEEGPNVFNPQFAGGTLMDLGVYPLYVAVDLFGFPSNVTYHFVPEPNSIDVFGTLVLEYKNFMVTIFISKGVHSRQKNEIYFQDKTIEISHISELSDIKLIDKKDNILDCFYQDLNNPMTDEAQFFADTLNGKITMDSYLEYEQLSYQVMDILGRIKNNFLVKS